MSKPDFIIEDKVVLEVKVSPVITKVMQDQVYYDIKGTTYQLALLVNFGTSKVGVKRLSSRLSYSNLRSSVHNL